MSSSEKKNINLAASVVAFFTFLSRILGLLRDMVIATMFGSGMVTDAFFVAFRIPNLLRRLFAEGSLTISFIPVFSEYLHAKSKEEAFKLAQIILTLLTLVLALVTVMGIIFAPWIVRFMAYGFGGSGDKYDLTVLLTRITFPYIFFISIVAFFMGVLNSLRHFAAPAAAPIFLNIAIIGSAYFLSPHMDQPIVALAIGVLIGGFLQLVIQIPWVIKEGFIPAPRWDLRHPGVKRISLMMLPAIYGSAIYQINQFVGTLLASFLQEGSVSWLYYADRLVQFPLGVFALAISTAALPSLSTEAAQNRTKEFGETLHYSLGLTFFIAFPATAGLIVMGKPIITILFQRGAFNQYDSLMTYRALIFYAMGLWAFSGTRIAVAAFYALKDTWTPVKVAIAAMVANLILSLFLMQFMNHAGLALSLSLASSIQLILLMAFIKRKVNTGPIKPVVISGTKALLSALGMGIILHLVHMRFLAITPSSGLYMAMANLILLVLFGVIVYLFFAYLMGSHEIDYLIQMVRPNKGLPEGKHTNLEK